MPTDPIHVSFWDGYDASVTMPWRDTATGHWRPAKSVFHMALAMEVQDYGDGDVHKLVMVSKALVNRGPRPNDLWNLLSGTQKDTLRRIVTSCEYLTDAGLDVTATNWLGQPLYKGIVCEEDDWPDMQAKWQEAVTVHLVDRLHSALKTSPISLLPRWKSSTPMCIAEFHPLQKMKLARVWRVVCKTPLWWM